MCEKKIKHLEFIQNIISRMANNSFLLKGWSVTLVAAILVLGTKDSIKGYILLSYIPLIVFWILDAYFLSKEKLFIDLYNKTRLIDENDIDFSIDIRQFGKPFLSWAKAFISFTLSAFYFTIIIAIVVVGIFIK